MWRSLRHPNVVPFLGVSAMMAVCLVSEWMANGTVTAFLLAHPTVERVPLVCRAVFAAESEAHVRISKLRNIVDGLRYVHSLGIVHGDLKAVGTV